MRAKKIKANSLRSLASRLKTDFKSSVYLSEQVEEFANNITEEEIDSKNPNLYAVALSLQHFYTALENIFKRIIKEFDGVVPSGESWHKELLELAVIEVEKIRPAIISDDILDKLDRIRRFRHVVRHGYEYELDWYQMKPLVESLSIIIPILKQDINDFIGCLIDIADEIENY